MHPGKKTWLWVYAFGEGTAAMRIDNTYLQNLEIRQNATAGQAVRSAAVRQAGESTGSLEGQSEHIPSPELQQYAALLQQEPEIRSDRLQAVAERLQQGYYSTPQSARQTAAAILKAVD
jgi:hypothetical protein